VCCRSRTYASAHGPGNFMGSIFTADMTHGFYRGS